MNGQVAEAKSITIPIKKPSNVNFRNEWERTTEIWYDDTQAMIGEICYGFDKTNVDEDYTWARSWYYKHKAQVKNSSGEFTSKARKATTNNTWKKKEVKHSGSSGQVYSIIFTNATSEDTVNDYSKPTTYNSDNHK